METQRLHSAFVLHRVKSLYMCHASLCTHTYTCS